MGRTKLRTVLALEKPEARHILGEVVQKELDGVVVGQADNSIKALTLARSLRPELVVVDARLPHVAGVDEVRLSRIGGLDTALDISKELPEAMVLLLSNGSATALQENDADGAAELWLYGETGTGNLRSRLREARRVSPRSPALFFASLRMKKAQSLRQRVIGASERAMLYGGLATLGGLGLMLTLILAAAGAALAAVGAGVFLAGLMARIGANIWPASRQIAQKNGEVEAEETEVKEHVVPAGSARMPRL